MNARQLTAKWTSLGLVKVNMFWLLQPPLRFFPGRSKTLKKVTKDI